MAASAQAGPAGHVDQEGGNKMEFIDGVKKKEVVDIRDMSG